MRRDGQAGVWAVRAYQVEHRLAILLDVLDVQQPVRSHVGAFRELQAPALSEVLIRRSRGDARPEMSSPDNVDALRKHLKQGDLPQGCGRHALLLHLRLESVGAGFSSLPTDRHTPGKG